MDVIGIPFVGTVGIVRTNEGKLALPFEQGIHNHLQTVHAGAQFALAETASGELLLSLFPDLADKVVPLLRDSQIKFRKPAQGALTAYPSITDEALDKFRTQFTNKGRSSLAVDVELKDAADVTTCVATFTWFVQGL